MEELNQLAARVWKRVAEGEAYKLPTVKETPRKPRENSLLPMLLILLLLQRRGREF